MGLMSSLFGGSKTVNNPATVYGAQQPYLQDVWGGAQSLAGQQQGQIGPFAAELSQQLGQQGQGFMQGLGQGAGQQLNPFINNSMVAPQIGALGGLLNRNLQQGLAGITDQGIAAGGIGSARSGMAAGQALGDTQLAYGSGVADILGQDVLRRQSAAGQQAGIQASSALGGLSQLGGLYNLGMQPFQSQWLPGLMQSQITGSPTVLGGGGTSTQQGGIIPGIGSLMGGAGTLAGAFR